MAAANAFTITISAADKASAVAKKIEASLARITKPIDRVTASAAKLNEATAKIKKPFSDFGSSLKKMSDETGLTRVANGLRGVGESAAEAGKKVLGVAASVGGLVGIGSAAGILLLASQWGKAGAEIGRTSAVLGVSAGDLQAFRGAAQLAGLSAEDMTGSLKSLGRTIEDATFGRNQDALVMMQKFGITLHRTKDGAVDATRALKDVANAIVAQKGNVQAQSLVAGAFGVESLLPLLQKGSKGIEGFIAEARKMGLVMSDAQIASARQYSVNMTKLDFAIQGVKNSIGNALLPVLSPLVDKLGKWAARNKDLIASKVSEYVERFSRWMDTIDWDKVASGAADFARQIGLLADRFIKWIDSVDWDKTAKKIGSFVDSIGGIKGIAAIIAGITFAGPIAGVLSLIASLATLTGTTVPMAAAALARLAGGPIMAAILALLHSKDLNTGEDDYLKGKQAAPGQQWTGDPIGDRRRAGAANDAQSTDAVAYFMKKGWTQQQASGIAANLWTESLFNPKAVGDNGHAFGVAQWHEDRQAEFKKLFGTDIRNSTKEQQFDFVDYELRKGKEQKAGDALSAAASAQDAGGIVSRLYERPADPREEYSRGQMAAAIDQKLHVDVHLHNAPAGTKATASVRGNQNATARVGTSNVTGPPV